MRAVAGTPVARMRAAPLSVVSATVVPPDVTSSRIEPKGPPAPLGRSGSKLKPLVSVTSIEPPLSVAETTLDGSEKVPETGAPALLNAGIGIVATALHDAPQRAPSVWLTAPGFGTVTMNVVSAALLARFAGRKLATFSDELSTWTSQLVVQVGAVEGQSHPGRARRPSAPNSVVARVPMRRANIERPRESRVARHRMAGALGRVSAGAGVSCPI